MFQRIQNKRRAEMRIETVECKTRQAAKRRCPWAAKIVKVEGGYMAFESITDYQMWRNQTR